MFNFVDHKYYAFTVVFLENRAYTFQMLSQIVIETYVDFIPEVELPVESQMGWFGGDTLIE